MTNDMGAGVPALVDAADDGVLTTTTEAIAEGTGVEHASVLRLVRDNLDDLNDVDDVLVGFEIRPRPSGRHGGGDRQVARLTEVQATLLLTYMRNNTVVRDFKKRLVTEFYRLRRAATEPAFTVPQTLPEALRAYAREVEAREAAQAYAAQLEPKAEYVDRFVSPDDCVQLRIVANQVGVGEVALRELLTEKRWIYRTVIGKRFSRTHNRVVEEHEWRAYADRRDYFRLIPQHKAPRHHNNQLRHTLYVTPQGARAIAGVVGASV